MTPTERKAHFNRVAAIPCVVRDCGRHPVTLHHPHGGSMVDHGITRGGAQKPSDWLVLPICDFHHQGKYGFDSSFGIVSAERKWGSQYDLVHFLCVVLNLDLFALAAADTPIRKKKSKMSSGKMLPR